MSMSYRVLAVALIAACGPSAAPAPARPAQPAQPAQPVQPASEPGADPAEVALWRRIKADKGAIPDGHTAAELIPKIIELLASPDPELRDVLGYEIVVAWVLDGERLAPDNILELTAALRAALRATPPSGEGDATLLRSFSVLCLSVVAARDVTEPILDEATRAGLLDDAVWYAAHETDLRGHTDDRGWIHAAAHTADLLKFLARNPALDVAASPRILDAVVSLVTRRHGYIFHYGEDARLAQPVLELLRRDAVSTDAVDAWLPRLLEPFSVAADSFEPVLYAAQRNARNLAFTLVASFELESERSATMEHARAALLGLLR